MQYAQKTNSEHELQFGMNPCSYISFFVDGRMSKEVFRPGPAVGPAPSLGKGGAHFLGSDPPSGPFVFFFCFFFFFLQFFAIFDTEVS